MPDPSPSRHVRFALAAATAAVIVGCAKEEPVLFDPEALRQTELRYADETEFRKLEAPDQVPLDQRGFLDVDRVTREEVERGTVADPGFGRISTQAPVTRSATRPTTLPMADDEFDPPTSVLLPLSECIRRATLNNYDISVAAFEPAIEATRTVEAMAAFDMTFQQRLEGRYNDSQIAGQAIDLSEIVNDLQRVVSLNSSLVQPLASGGQASLTANLTYLDSPASFDRGLTLLEETYESGLTFRLQQPLLSGFGRNVNRARISISQNNRRISLLDFRQQLEQTLLEVEETYWSLYRARREVDIQRDLLQRTIDTAERIRQRLGQDANPGQVAEATRDIGQRRSNLILAEANAANLSAQLKFLMNDPDLPVAGDTMIVTATNPIEMPVTFDYSDALETALLFRPEIGQEQLRVLSADVAFGFGQNALLPRLDVILEAGFQGLSDEIFEAVENQFEFNNLNFAAGVQFEVPLGNRAPRATAKRARLQKLQAVTRFAAAKEQIALEVKQAQQDVSASYAALIELRLATNAAAEAVRVTEAQEENVQLTPQFTFQKLRNLSSLAEALSQEEQALVQYNIAIAAYQRAKGTLLRYNNIVLDEGMVEQVLPKDVLTPLGRGVAP
jgi:outer membrane protein TolC